MKLSTISKKPVFTQKKSGLSPVGMPHTAVFSPDGRRLVGFLVKRPDIASMIKRKDLFLALDACDIKKDMICARLGKESFDAAALERLGLDLNLCLIWRGMDAKTTDGTELGYVNDAEIYLPSGEAESFFIGESKISRQLVGSLEVPADMLRGYSKGFMLLAPEAADLSPNGGVVAKAGVASAKAKQSAAAAGKKIGKQAGKAIDKGSRAMGRQLGRLGSAFSAFADEYKKAKK